MPQICAWFGEDIEKRIVKMAEDEGTSKSKMVVSLVERGLNSLEFEHTLSQKEEQLGLALYNLNQLQNEIIPPLKLLMEGQEKKLGFWARFKNR